MIEAVLAVATFQGLPIAAHVLRGLLCVPPSLPQRIALQKDFPPEPGRTKVARTNADIFGCLSILCDPDYCRIHAGHLNFNCGGEGKAFPLAVVQTTSFASTPQFFSSVDLIPAS